MSFVINIFTVAIITWLEWELLYCLSLCWSPQPLITLVCSLFVTLLRRDKRFLTPGKGSLTGVNLPFMCSVNSHSPHKDDLGEAIFVDFNINFFAGTQGLIQFDDDCNQPTEASRFSTLFSRDTCPQRHSRTLAKDVNWTAASISPSNPPLCSECHAILEQSNAFCALFGGRTDVDLSREFVGKCAGVLGAEMVLILTSETKFLR